MISINTSAIRLAKILRDHCELLIAGGPLPSVIPKSFLDTFDIVVRGEGEKTVLEITESLTNNQDFSNISGIVYRNKQPNGEVVYTKKRELISNLNLIPFPARELLPNQDYQNYWRDTHGYTVTSIMTTRGCLYQCEYCSNAVFGVSYRERSAENVVDEVQAVLDLGYDRIFFQDDCFTINKERVIKICEEIQKRELDFHWECLSRVTTINRKLARRMRKTGCCRVYFGIESGNNHMLRLMRKQATVEEARNAVETVNSENLSTMAFFIIGYPGDTEETILETINFSSSLPLDDVSFTLPYPIPGTALYERVRNRMINNTWNKRRFGLIDHVLLFHSQFSEAKLKFAIMKGMIQFKIKKYLGKFSPIIYETFKKITDYVFRKLK